MYYLYTTFQLTWLPNEVENHDFVLVQFLDRVLSPKSNNTINPHSVLVLFVLFKGWLVKLWECISDDGVLVLCTSSKHKTTTLSNEIGKWLVIH